MIPEATKVDDKNTQITQKKNKENQTKKVWMDGQEEDRRMASNVGCSEELGSVG